MGIKSDFGTITALLNYNASTGGAKNNRFVFPTEGKKIITDLFCTYQNQANVASTLQWGRVLVCKGKHNEDEIFIDPLIDNATPNDFQTLKDNGIEEVLADFLVYGAGPHILLRNAKIEVGEGYVLSVYQTPMYRSGDAVGSPGSTYANLTVLGRREFGSGKDKFEFNLR